LTVAVPLADGAVKVAVQLAVPVVAPATRLQGEPLKLPDTPVSVKATVPPGVTGLPVAELSITVAVQVEA